MTTTRAPNRDDATSAASECSDDVDAYAIANLHRSFACGDDNNKSVVDPVGASGARTYALHCTNMRIHKTQTHNTTKTQTHTYTHTRVNL